MMPILTFISLINLSINLFDSKIIIIIIKFRASQFMQSISPFLQLLSEANELILEQLKEIMLRNHPQEVKKVSRFEDSLPIMPFLSDNSLKESSKSFNYLYSVPSIPNLPASRKEELLPWKKSENSLIKTHFERQIISQKKMTCRRKQLKRQPFIHWNNVEDINEDVTLKGKDGKSIFMRVSGLDLLSLKGLGPMNERIILNYLNYLIASNIMNSSIHIFPFAFISNLMNSFQSETQITMERFVAGIKKSYDTLKSKITVNIFDFDDVVVPFRNGNHFSAFIIHNLKSYEQKKSQACLVYCDSKDIVIHDIVEAIRLFLQFELLEKKGVIAQFNQTTLPFFQIMVPRQTTDADSSLYMTLNIQTLLGKGSEQLQNLKKPQNRKKLHIYPRILALSMRQRIWNSFNNILKVKTNQMRLKMAHLIQEERKKIIKTNTDDDYDRINKKELRKYQVLHGLTHRVQGKEMDDDNYANELQFYLDSNINYLESNPKED